MRKVKQRETPPRTLERYLAGLYEAAPTIGAESDSEVQAGLEPVLPVLAEAGLEEEAQVGEHVAQNVVQTERDRERAEFERRGASLNSKVSVMSWRRRSSGGTRGKSKWTTQRNPSGGLGGGECLWPARLGR